MHLQVEQIRTWIQLWQQASATARASYTKAWRVARDMLQRTRSWSQVHGPIGATILTLIENGWVPAQPTLWIDKEKDQFATLEAQEPHALHDMLQAFELSITKRAWRKAAAHYKSEGLERKIPSFEPAVQARKVLSKMAARQATQPTDTERPFLPASARMAALNAVNSGGSTIGARFRPPRPCPRCNCALETAEHRYFTCPANTCPELLEVAPAILKTNFIARQFQHQVPPAQYVEECMWARGLLPANRCTDLQREPEPATIEAGDFRGAATSSGVVYTDGSGGPGHVHKTVRRVGVGAAALSLRRDDQGTYQLDNIGLLFGTCPGRQTVPRAETVAGHMALSKAAEHHIDSWYCDASYTVRGASEHSIARMSAGANGDVWTMLKGALDMQRQGLSATKVRAHQTLREVAAGVLTFEQYLGNGFADIAADVSAVANQPEQPLVEYSQSSFSLCFLLNMRLAAIEAHVWHVASSSRVPAPLLPPLPLSTDMDAARAHSLSKIRASGHALYKRGRFLVCSRCQRRKLATKAHLWLTTPCIRAQPPPPAADTRADPQEIATLALAESRQTSEPDDDFDLDAALEDEAEFEFQERGAEPQPEEPLVSVSAARSARRQYFVDKRKVEAENAATMGRAAIHCAVSAAATELSQLIEVADGNLPVEGPPWIAAAHSTHALYYYGGFVTCVSCGMLAQRSIARSKLLKPCVHVLSKERRLGVRRLALGKFPRTDYTEWPDGGLDVRAGASLRRLAQPAATSETPPPG